MMSKTEQPHTAEIATVRRFIETAELDDISNEVREFVEKYFVRSCAQAAAPIGPMNEPSNRQFGGVSD